MTAQGRVRLRCSIPTQAKVATPMKITPSPRTTSETAAPVTVTQPVHRGIWQTAMRYAGGDPKRITRISATEVEVLVRG